MKGQEDGGGRLFVPFARPGRRPSRPLDGQRRGDFLLSAKRLLFGEFPNSKIYKELWH